VRNLYRYTRIYSGQEPELIEGDVFTTIIPLTRSVTLGVTEKVTEKVTEGEADVLRLIAEIPAMTQSAMAERLAVSRKTIVTRLRALKDKGIVYREGSDKKGAWRTNEGFGSEVQ
jgi:ATP-dependent DNA helicase RecG